MKKNVKLFFAVVIVVVAMFGGVKAYGVYRTAPETELLSENVEALSSGGEGVAAQFKCVDTKYTCHVICDGLPIIVVEGKLSK